MIVFKFYVVVGNIGNVHFGNDEKEAIEVFKAYKQMSHDGVGRAAGEVVTLCNAEGEPIEQYLGADGE